MKPLRLLKRMILNPFLERNVISSFLKLTKRGGLGGSRAVSEEKVPDKEEIRKILMHLPVHGRALFLTLLSSGMRHTT